MIRRARNRLRTLIMFYRRHLRVQPLRELTAVAGVAAGVALLFAVQTAHRSITGSFEQIVHGVAGRATLEVAGRGPEGFGEGISEEIARLPDVKVAAPVMQTQIVAGGPRGARALTLLGATEALAALEGKLIARSQREAEAARRGLLLLTEPTARAIGVRPGSLVTVRVAERTEHLTLDATIPSSEIGPLSESPVAAAPLAVVQVLAGLPGHITRILIEPQPGRAANLRRALGHRFGAKLNVRSVDSEPHLLANAASPENQLAALFSAISLVVGIILAYNALLLASEERRRFIVYLIQLGTPDSVIVGSLAFDALILGLAGSLIGLLVGDAISLYAYRTVPGYITAAFAVGGQRVVDWQTILLALGAGLIAAFAAAALPAVALLRSGAAAEPEAVGPALSLARRFRFGDSFVFAGGLILVCGSVAASLLQPTLSTVALVTLAAGLVLCLPMIARYLLRLARAGARHTSDPAARLATGQLQSSPTLPVALLATGVITLFLVVTIGGPIADVQRAVRTGAAETGSGADLWIRPGGAENIYATQPFAYANTQRRLERLGVVRQVLPWRSSFLDLTNRRVWVIGVPGGFPTPIARGQLVQGVPYIAEQRLREGGWAAISQAIATELHLRMGERFTMPTPSGPASFRLAAIIANYGWTAGTVLINGADYATLWPSDKASQLSVSLYPGASVQESKRAVQQALPRGSALGVQTDAERQSQVSAVLGSTLSRLSATTVVVLLVAIASVVTMMVAAVSQRRSRLDALMSIGMSSGQLARLIFYESGSVLLAGCLIGLAAGILGQYLAENALHQITAGSTVPFAPAWQLGLRTLAIATGISILASVVAVLRTVGFQPRTAFSTE